jgi:branched-chain amino acid transport system substrate-binding protein
MSKKILGLLICVSLIASFSVGRQVGIKEAQKKSTKVLGAQTNKNNTITIGAILPLTGGYASVAEEVNRGALIAIEEAKERGEQINYVVEDDQFKASMSANAANKLINQNKVDAVFTMAIEEVKPVATIFNSAKILILATWDSNAYIKTAGDYVFSTGYNTEANGEKMAEFAYNKLNLRKIASLQQIDEWSKIIAEAFNAKFKALGGSIVVNEKVIVEEKDFRTIVTKIKQSGAEGIYAPFNPPGNSRLLTQVKQLGFTGQMLAADGFIQDEIDTAGKAAENVYLTDIFTENADGLKASYTKKYNSEPSALAFVTFGYDAVNTFLEAKKISVAQNISLRDALTQVKIQGAGALINMDGKQFSEKVERIYKIVNGIPVEVK